MKMNCNPKPTKATERLPPPRTPGMTTPMPPQVSVVVNTLDAERFLAFALRSVRPWADEIVVVDMQSTDRTVAIARAHGARILSHPRAHGCVEPARAFAVAAASHPWVLVLDADELVPPALARRLLALAARGDVDAARIPRLNHLLGAPLLHTGWNPARDRHLRFFRAGAVVVPTHIHEPFRGVVGARVVDLAPVAGEMLVHFNYTDVDDFVARLARYTSVEAAEAIAGGAAAPGVGRALASALREWLVRFVWHGGWRDGWRGRHIAVLMAAYRVIVAAKIASRAHLGGEDDVAARYAREAERVLAEYEALTGAAAIGAPASASERHNVS